MSGSPFKRIWRVYYDSYAFHVYVLSIIAVIILPSVISTTAAQRVSIALELVSSILLANRAPHFVADIEIPRWYTLSVNCYLSVLTAIFVTSIDSLLVFSFYIYPIAVIPVVMAMAIVLIMDDEFDIEEDLE